MKSKPLTAYREGRHKKLGLCGTTALITGNALETVAGSRSALPRGCRHRNCRAQPRAVHGSRAPDVRRARHSHRCSSLRAVIQMVETAIDPQHENLAPEFTPRRGQALPGMPSEKIQPRPELIQHGSEIAA